MFNSNCHKYIVLWAGNVYSPNIRYKIVKEEIFMTELQKHKLNEAYVRKITKNLNKTTF